MDGKCEEPPKSETLRTLGSWFVSCVGSFIFPVMVKKKKDLLNRLEEKNIRKRELRSYICTSTAHIYIK